MSTKMLADVVESLIGASYLDGGVDRALTCIRTFLPEVEWHTLDTARGMLAAQKAQRRELPSTLAPLETLLGRTFRNKTLAVEAMTHSSFGAAAVAGEACMERLEFIGDAVLDNVVVAYLWGRDAAGILDHFDMHLLRAACVNADLLGFLMMEWAYEEEATVARTEDADANADPEINANTDADAAEQPSLFRTTTRRVPVWKLMRHSSPRLGEAQTLAELNHAASRDAIVAHMRDGADYPWAALARLEIPKSFSDLFEAILGAVWLDASAEDAENGASGDGDDIGGGGGGGAAMDACRRVAERVGILPYLRRMVADGVVAAHPKNRLGELASSMGREVIYEPERIRRKRREGEGEGGDGDGGEGGDDEGGKAGTRCEWVCRVFLAGELFVEVDDGVNKEEVVTKAADVAFRKLAGENCENGPEGEGEGEVEGEAADFVMA